MKIAVRDAFGAILGVARVEWLPVSDFDTLKNEISMIFLEEVMTLPLPTRNENMAWRFDVYPHLDNLDA